MAVAWVQAAIAIAAQAVTLILACRLVQVPVARALRAMAGPALACGGLALVLIGVAHGLTTPWLAVLAGALAGAVAYLALLGLLARDLLVRLRALVPGRRSPAPAAAG